MVRDLSRNESSGPTPFGILPPFETDQQLAFHIELNHYRSRPVKSPCGPGYL